MQCFICVTYMIFACAAHPALQPSPQHQKRSIFHDVIESLRIRSHLPEYNQHEGNNLDVNYESYSFKDEPQLPSDAVFIPRRNDRIEMPSLKYRYPKSITFNHSDDESPKQEIVLYIDTTQEPKTTQKPKKPKRTRPPTNRTKIPNRNKDDEVIDENETQKPDDFNNIPWTNTMAGQSQIGNRESQMVVKPTVIVNIRGTVSHRDSDIKVQGRTKNETLSDYPQNVFNIKQEIKVERTFDGMGSHGGQKIVPSVQQGVKVEREVGKSDEDMIMCESATWNPEKNGRQGRNIFQILFSV